MKPIMLIVVVAILGFWSDGATAFWGSDTKKDASGLNVAAGFDANTITTLTGTVVTLPEHKGQDQHTIMSVETTQGAVMVVLGPWGYWEKQAFAVSANQELTITGSRAQGKDGAIYLFAQRLESRDSGNVNTLTLRSESGVPLWSRAGSAGRNGGRHPNGNGASRGTGHRSGGMRGGRR